ncbi:MAG: LLM class flavin-dependent oxidoreductase [Bacillota bacterium]|nr:LLM class flavin-dependent oxidoreductase [Bacillota bacterium]
MEIGLFTFGDMGIDPETGKPITPQERMRRLMEEVKLADEVGLDVWAVGEHHRPDYVVSSPSTVLAGAATITEKIRLSSAVVVLSSEDPVRVFQQFATVDLLSGGRAEIMAGRGSFIESFPLFGYELDDYEELFTEKLDLLLRIRKDTFVTWRGEHRAPLHGQGIFPRPIQNPLPVWLAVGGTPASAARAGSLGLPMSLAIIGGLPERFTVFARIHRQAAEKAGLPQPPLAISAHGFIADTPEEAVRLAFPAFSQVMNRIGRERGWAPMTEEQFQFSRSLRGADFVGSPQEIVEKILYQHELFGHQRFLMQMVGLFPHRQVLRSIELLGDKVAPEVRKALKASSPI